MSSEDDDGLGRKGESGEDSDDDRCPPPEEEEKEMLFLIEFLVDTMLLKPENMDLQDFDPCLLQGQTCICLTFLHYPPMSICEKDIDPCRQTGTNYIRFNAGKSLMFALSESQFENPPPIFLDVTAYKMLPHGTIPGKLQIGATKIDLSELFKQVFEKVDEKPEKLPLSKSIKDKYQLVGKKNKCPTAEVTIYIRLSCLGQNIVTEFQRGGNECEPFLFKNRESAKVYQCLAKDAPEEDPEDLCPPMPGWGLSLGKDCGNGDGCNTGVGSTMESGGGGPPTSGGSLDVSNSNIKSGAAMDGEDEFDEFGAEVHGHALTIKVQKSRKKQLAENETKSEINPKEQMSNDVSFQMPQSSKLCKGKGKSSNKAEVYDMSEGSKSGGGAGCSGGGGGSTQIVQGVDSPDKDIFVLRIGKKGDTGKGKLELELRTPKAKIERVFDEPRKWDKNVQTDNDETEGKGKKKKKKN